jgi:ectoine hydroxylase-related dioxygenase (phytanoyl-CoA dioxygenase family)
MSTLTIPHTLPALDNDYALARQQISDFQQKGHVLIPRLASEEEVSAYRPAIAETLFEHKFENRPFEERDTFGKAFLQAENLWEKSDAGRYFVFARRFARVAAQLMGVPAVRLYHDNILFKEAGGGPTPWHQDQHHWPIGSDNTLTLWMPMVDISADMGSLTFVDGTHKLGYLGHFNISDESQKVFGEMIKERNLHLHTYGAMNAGDATFHYGWTLHSAPGNPTDRVREVMTIIYYADGALVSEPDNKPREVDLANNFPGLRPGDVAATERNPVLYAAD